jgi:hypothetical protein
MRRSDNTYEDLDPEDPVMDMAKMVRQELPGMFRGDGGGETSSTTATTTTLGGLDMIAAELLKSPQIQQAVSNLVAQILQSPEFKRTVQVLIKELWTDLVEDPETLKQVIHLLQYAIQDEQIKEASIQLVTEVFSDKEVLDELVVLVERLGQEKQVRRKLWMWEMIVYRFVELKPSQSCVTKGPTSDSRTPGRERTQCIERSRNIGSFHGVCNRCGR